MRFRRRDPSYGVYLFPQTPIVPAPADYAPTIPAGLLSAADVTGPRSAIEWQAWLRNLDAHEREVAPWVRLSRRNEPTAYFEISSHG